MKLFIHLTLAFSCALASASTSRLKVITSTETVADLVKSIGGEHVQVETFSRGTEDPHYIEAKPSFMVKARDAQLVVVVGLDLEAAWMNNVLKGSRNPNVTVGHRGHLDLGQFISALDKIEGKLDRGQGDVHPFGNPHYYLDPERIREILPKISEKLAELQPEHKEQFEQNAKNLGQTLSQKIDGWKKRVQTSGVKKVITYHKTFVYFLNRFGIQLVGTLEPKPGLPPTASHVMTLIKEAKNQNVQCILNENHFETIAAQRLAKDHPMKIMSLSTEVGGSPKAKDYVALIEEIVSGVESCGAFTRTSK